MHLDSEIGVQHMIEFLDQITHRISLCAGSGTAISTTTAVLFGAVTRACIVRAIFQNVQHLPTSLALIGSAHGGLRKTQTGGMSKA